MNFKIVIFLCIQYSLGIVMGNELTAEFVSLLPTPIYEHSAIYDGEDSIYIFGGFGHGEYNLDIYRYSLKNFTISTVGKLLDVGLGGSLQADSKGNIFYIEHTNVYKFDVQTQNISRVADLPNTVLYGSSVKYNDSQVIILGGVSSNRTFSFNMETNVVTEVGALPFEFFYGTASKVKNEAFLFRTDHLPLVKFDLETLETETVYPADYPGFYNPASITVLDKYIYVGLGQRDSSGVPTQGIYQFDTETYRTDYIYISNFFEDKEYFLYSPANVYVEKENRIYFLGGLSYFTSDAKVKLHDEIWYLDLNQLDATVPPTTEVTTASTTAAGTTMDPNIFNCKNKTDGSYPHPSDCAQFIICREEEMELFECQPPLLFDPLLGTCNWPDNVDCGLTCVDRPDGPYPHPHDCAFFIVCHGGKLDVFRCSEGLLFDPVFKVCRYADLVDCDGK